MHKQTLDIVEVIDSDDARKKDLVPIPDEEIDDVRRMNRKQRRAWLSQQRKKAGVK